MSCDAGRDPRFGTLRKNPSSRVGSPPRGESRERRVDWETRREKAWIFLEAINVCRAIYHPFDISCLRSSMLFSALCIPVSTTKKNSGYN